MNSPANIDDRIRLTKLQAKALEAVVSEHRQTHRGTPVDIVQVYCGARDECDLSRVRNAVARLYRLGLVEVKGDDVIPVVGCIDRIAPGEPVDDEPESAPKSDTAPAPSVDERPPVRPASRDTLRTRAGGAPKPVTRPALSSTEGGSAIHKAGSESPMSDKRPTERTVYPQSEEHIHPEVGVSVSPELLDRCAAMHLSLLEQALAAYAQGDEAAGREIMWLRETGRQLVAAGGGA